MPKKIPVYVTAPAPSRYVTRNPAADEPVPAAESAAPEPPRPRMQEVLPAQYLETRPPLMYRLVKESEATRTYARIAKSRIYRANAFSCTFFYKPISRCLIEWEEE